MNVMNVAYCLSRRLSRCLSRFVSCLFLTPNCDTYIFIFIFVIGSFSNMLCLPTDYHPWVALNCLIVFWYTHNWAEHHHVLYSTGCINSFPASDILFFMWLQLVLFTHRFVRVCDFCGFGGSSISMSLYILLSSLLVSVNVTWFLFSIFFSEPIESNMSNWVPTKLRENRRGRTKSPKGGFITEILYR